MKSAKPADFDFEDYLAGAKHNLENYSYPILLRLFFKEVHGLETDKAIGARIGFKPSWFSQCLKEPGRVRFDAFRTILDQFPNPEHRRYLLRAYLLETLGEDFISDKEREYRMSGSSTREIQARLKMLKRQGRLRSAEVLCDRASDQTSDPEFKFLMLYESFQLCETLAQFGFAHRRAVRFISAAEALGDEHREIFGHSMRFRVKARCPRFAIEGVAKEIEALRQRFLLLPARDPSDKRILLPTEFYLWSTWLNILVGAAEQGYFRISDALATRMHEEIDARLSKETDPTNVRLLKLVRARLHGVCGQHAALVEELSEYAESANPDIQTLRHLATLQSIAKVEENDYDSMFAQLRQLYQTSMSFQDYGRARVAQLRIAELGERYFYDAEFK